MEKTHTLESGDDLFHKPISNDMFEKQSYGNAGLALPTSCLETPSGLIWISCTISVRPWPNRQIAKFGWESIRTITNDLSVTVPFSPAIVLGPSSKTGALVAVSHPYSFQPSRLFKTRDKTYSRRGRNQRRRYRGQERQRRWSWAHGRGWWRMRGLHARVRKSTT